MADKSSSLSVRKKSGRKEEWEINQCYSE